MLDEVCKRLVQQARVEALARLQHQRHVPVIRKCKLLLEEPTLNRCKRHITRNLFVCRVIHARDRGDRGQSGGSRMLKDLARR